MDTTATATAATEALQTTGNYPTGSQPSTPVQGAAAQPPPEDASLIAEAGSEVPRQNESGQTPALGLGAAPTTPQTQYYTPADGAGAPAFRSGPLGHVASLGAWLARGAASQASDSTGYVRSNLSVRTHAAGPNIATYVNRRLSLHSQSGCEWRARYISATASYLHLAGKITGPLPWEDASDKGSPPSTRSPLRTPLQQRPSGDLRDTAASTPVWGGGDRAAATEGEADIGQAPLQQATIVLLLVKKLLK